MYDVPLNLIGKHLCNGNPAGITNQLSPNSRKFVSGTFAPGTKKELQINFCLSSSSSRIWCRGHEGWGRGHWRKLATRERSHRHGLTTWRGRTLLEKEGRWQGLRSSEGRRHSWEGGEERSWHHSWDGGDERRRRSAAGVGRAWRGAGARPLAWGGHGGKGIRRRSSGHGGEAWALNPNRVGASGYLGGKERKRRERRFASPFSICSVGQYFSAIAISYRGQISGRFISLRACLGNGGSKWMEEDWKGFWEILTYNGNSSTPIPFIPLHFTNSQTSPYNLI
jgi:hypothetical protein